MSLWHCDAELCSMKNPYVLYHSRKNALFHGPSLTIVCQWGNFGALLPPRGTTYTPLRGMFSHSLITSSYVVIYMFLRNSRSELRLVKVGRNALSMRFFARFFAHCTIIVRPIAYKVIARHSSIGRTIWRLFRGSVTNGAGGVARQNLYGRRRIIISTQHNTSDALAFGKHH